VLPDQLPSVLMKLFSYGPVLYLGLLLAIDPAKVGRLAEMVIHAENTFQHQLRGIPWQHRWHGPEEVNVSKAWRVAIRFTGLTLAAHAFLSIAAPR